MAVRQPAEGRLRGLRFAAGLVCAALAGWPVAALASLTGSYSGTGPATGMAMVLNESNGQVYGRMVDGQGNIYRLSGEIDGGIVDGRLYSQEAAAAFELLPQSSGLEFTLIPTTSDGRANRAAAKAYAFARSKAVIKALASFRVTPPKRGESVDTLAFLENYRGWKDKDVANAYRSISDRDRALINRFDHLQADLMARLCRGGAPTASIMAVSDKEHLDCAETTALVDQNQQIGSMQGFDATVDSQRNALYGVLACSRGSYPAGRCTDINAIVKHAAESWQDVSQIFADLFKIGVRTGAVQDEIVAFALTPQIKPETPVPQTAPPADQSKRPAVAPKLKRVPIPRDRPIVFEHEDTLGQAPPASVDDFVLATADQSAVIARPRKIP